MYEYIHSGENIYFRLFLNHILLPYLWRSLMKSISYFNTSDSLVPPTTNLYLSKSEHFACNVIKYGI